MLTNTNQANQNKSGRLPFMFCAILQYCHTKNGHYPWMRIHRVFPTSAPIPIFCIPHADRSILNASMHHHHISSSNALMECPPPPVPPSCSLQHCFFW